MSDVRVLTPAQAEQEPSASMNEQQDTPGAPVSIEYLIETFNAEVVEVRS